MHKITFVGGELDGRTEEIPELVETLEVKIDLGDLHNYLPLYHTLIYEYIGDNQYKFKGDLPSNNYHKPAFEQFMER